MSWMGTTERLQDFIEIRLDAKTEKDHDDERADPSGWMVNNWRMA